MTISPAADARTVRATVETRASWVVALTALGIYAVAFAAPAVTVVALKPIAVALGGGRSVPALAYSLAWIGTAFGGVVMGRVAERVGVRWTVGFGALMIAIGLALSSTGGRVALYIGHGLFMGLLGNAGINAPLYVYVARWFDRRRGSALALISSGQSIAGTIWPSMIERAIERLGWQHTMLLVAAIEIAIVMPVALIMLRPPPELPAFAAAERRPAGAAVLGWPPAAVQSLLCLAGFLCCVPMAMPQGHLVAFCSDLGIPAAHGAAMLSVLLGCAFISRQFWGWVADRIGGLKTILFGSVCQVTAMAGFLLTQDEAGLFAVAAVFGLGFSGIVPAYVLAVRDLFPASEASWRVPIVLLCSGCGMAAGGWLAGAIYDWAGFYTAAFAAGMLVNLFHIAVAATLVRRQYRFRYASFVGAG